MAQKVGKVKREVTAESIDSQLQAEIKALVAQPIRDAIMISNKTARQERLDQILADTIEKLKKTDDLSRERHVKIVFHQLEYTEVRKMILEKSVPSRWAWSCRYSSDYLRSGSIATSPWFSNFYPRRNTELGGRDVRDDRR